MILNSQEDTVKMYDFEYKMITFVAIVRHCEISSTKATYTLEDISGRINAHLWVEDGATIGTNIMINTYVRVIGSLRHQANTKSIMIFKIRPVIGINEVNTHYLEVVNARYMAEAYANGDHGTTMKMDVDDASSTTTTTAAAINNGSDDKNDKIKGKDLLIFQAIQQGSASSVDTGMDRKDIHKKFPKMSEAEINSILERMLNDGTIYSTLDSDHFSSCFA